MVLPLGCGHCCVLDMVEYDDPRLGVRHLLVNSGTLPISTSAHESILELVVVVVVVVRVAP